MKVYSFNGLSGCVVQRVCRMTGYLVGLYNNSQAQLDNTEPWSTVCEKHNTICSHHTLQSAFSCLAFPDWCEECMREQGKLGPAKTVYFVTTAHERG